ncbi:MAG: glycine cleavage system aminomethyltransferase GcvT [Thermoproteota archaeon]|nr:glycine cleavage system aminomethyltransferase GcvT [Thermoproteota archaeon]
MRTPFYDIHKSLGAKIVNFHGWEMPLQYSGIMDEHINVRINVGLFDVSHMGRFEIKGQQSLACLQRLITNDLEKLQDHQALYSPMCYEDGGIVDDIIAYKLAHDKYLVVVNASNRSKDFEWISKHSISAHVEDISDRTSLLAIQGPRACDLLQKLVETDLQSVKPFHCVDTNIDGIECMLSRTGYTGEDGFEMFFDSSRIEVWHKLMQNGKIFGIKPTGLGARDTLRLEAGLMLYGNDMDENTTPLEVPLKWTISFDKKQEFIGKKALMNSHPSRKLVGFELLEKRIARQGNKVLLKGREIGLVTSGSFSPTLKKSIGFCFVPIEEVFLNQLIEIDIGGKHYEAKISGTRFYKRK